VQSDFPARGIMVLVDPHTQSHTHTYTHTHNHKHTQSHNHTNTRAALIFITWLAVAAFAFKTLSKIPEYVHHMKLSLADYSKPSQ